MSFDLFTSIPPDRYSAPCVDSWRAAGFQVVSVNHRDEAKAVRAMGVETVEFSGIGRKPPISAIMEAIAARNPTAAGIVNADCRMLSPATAAAIAAHTNGSMVMCRRINIDQDGWVAERSPLGFDAFFFDPILTCLLAREPFLMGTPWWDYWLPVRAHQMSMRLLHGTPILTHLVHGERWSNESWQAGAREFLASTGPDGLPFQAAENVGDLANDCYKWLCERPAVDLIAPDISGVLGSYLDATDCFKRELHRYTNSLSWRITRPLRAFRNVRAAKALLRLARVR